MQLLSMMKISHKSILIKSNMYMIILNVMVIAIVLKFQSHKQAEE